MFIFFFFKQKTAYEMRISDWSSDVCSSDLLRRRLALADATHRRPLVSDDAAVPPGTPRRLDGGVSTSPRGPARSACVALTQPLDWKTFRCREKRVLRRDQRQIRRTVVPGSANDGVKCGHGIAERERRVAAAEVMAQEQRREGVARSEARRLDARRQIGRASCRERVCQYV